MDRLEYEAQLMRPKGSSRGVIRVDPGDSDDVLRSQTTCESAVILDIRRLGWTNLALVTFDTPYLPRTVRNYELCKVKPYVPHTLVCYRCHRAGHLQKHCPNLAVCSKCGRPHEGDQCPDGMPYCNLCKKTGHTSCDANCPLKISRLQSMRKRMQQRSIRRQEFARQKRQLMPEINSTLEFPHLSPTSTPFSTIVHSPSRERSANSDRSTSLFKTAPDKEMCSTFTDAGKSHHCTQKQAINEVNAAPTTAYLESLYLKMTTLQTQLSSWQLKFKQACAAHARKQVEYKRHQEIHCSEVHTNVNSYSQTSGPCLTLTATELEQLVSKMIGRHLDTALSTCRT